MVKLMVLYPRPQSVDRFEAAYKNHLSLLHEKMGLPAGATPYSITRFIATAAGDPPYHLMFTLPFESAEALTAAMGTPGMKAVATDATRISTGGAPLILVGGE